MATLKYVGGTANRTDEVAIRSYIASLLAGNLTQNQVDAAIASRLSTYSSVSAVDAKDNLLADSAFIDAADNTRLDKNNLNKPGYPFTLQSDGKVPVGKVKTTTTQKYPNTTAATTGSGATTTSEVGLFTLSVPDPGYPYRVLVMGTVHGQVSTDTGAFPRILVYRSDNQLVASGNGIAESYQAPALGSVSSRMYVSIPYTPSYSSAIWNGQWSYSSDWQNLSWSGVTNDTFTTVMSGNTYLQANSNMSNVSLAARVSFANGIIPQAGLGPGSLTSEIRLYSSSKGGVIATSSPSTLITDTLTVNATIASVSKGDLFTVQARQTVICPWGTLFPGSFATWAPSSSGVSNTMTLIPGLAPDLPAGEISILPTPLASQTTITGSTVLSVRLQSPGGSSVTAYSAPAPRLTAIPIPA